MMIITRCYKMQFVLHLFTLQACIQCETAVRV